MQISSFEEAHKVLETYVPRSRSMSAPYTLGRMQKLMEHLGNPQDNLKVIHVAGTSGKTSTSYYVSALLKEAGLSVGLSVSPHIDEVNERLQVNLIPLPEKQYCQVLAEFIGIVEKSGIKPTYFETLVALAYWYFAKEGLDYAVIEVGMGGLLDGTNVVSRPDKVCVITDIGLDHTSVLGKTLPEITAQKAGIIHQHNVVFCYEQTDEVMAVIREVSESQQAELHELKVPPREALPPHLPLFQRRNWYLAYRAFLYIAERDGQAMLTPKQMQSSTNVRIPARMEVIKLGSKTIIIDGAHNAQKLKALGESINEMFPGKKPAVLFSLIQSSNLRLKTSIKALTNFSGHLILTSFQTQQDFVRESINPRRVLETSKGLGFSDLEVIRDNKKAYEALLARPEKIVVITGSFYLLNHIRPLIFTKKK